MDFVAIDFETANEKISSVCQIGLAVVKNSKIVEKTDWLVRPVNNVFCNFNTYIHKITPQIVENKPEFNEVWPQFKKYLEGQIIVAHNASFDINVLRSVLEEYGLKCPMAEYLCSVKIAKKTWPDVKKHGLKSLSDFLSIEFSHHHAAEDAYASAQIVLMAAKKTKVNNWHEFLKKLEMMPGKIYPGGHKPLRQLNQFNLKIADTSKLDPNHPLYGQTVVFTGRLESMIRDTAMQKVADLGGICAASVNEYTDLLVIGNKDHERFKKGFKSSKLKKAERLIEDGNSIDFVTEKELLDLLKVF